MCEAVVTTTIPANRRGSLAINQDHGREFPPMKRTLLAAALIAVAGVAQAQVTFNNDQGSGVKNREFNPAPGIGMPDFAGPVQLGTVTSAYGQLTFTYLGQESGFTD